MNIFGGSCLRRDRRGVIAAGQEVGSRCRRRAPGRDERRAGEEDPDEFGLSVIAADDLADAAEKIVKAVKG